MSSVSTLGSSLDPNPTYTFDPDTATLYVERVNREALQSQDFIYVVLGPVINPAVTAPTASFTYTIYDD